jgi:hypothetical protein
LKQSWILLPKALKNRYVCQITNICVVDQSLDHS